MGLAGRENELEEKSGKRDQGSRIGGQENSRGQSPNYTASHGVIRKGRYID